MFSKLRRRFHRPQKLGAIFVAPSQPLQVLASGTFVAAAAGSVSLPAMAGVTTVLAGVTVSIGIAGAASHGIWTVSDGIWTQSYYVMFSTTVPGSIDLDFVPGIYATNVNTAITISVPAITNGSPYAISAQGYRI